MTRFHSQVRRRSRAQTIRRHACLVCAFFATALATLGLLSATVFADELILENGQSITDAEISAATWEQVEYRARGISSRQRHAAEKIDRIRWTSEGGSMSRGRGAYAKGDFAKAVSAFRASTSVSKEVHSLNAQYMLGLAELAWGRQDPGHIPLAVTALKNYVSAAKTKKHFYTPHGVLALADAHLAARDYSNAERVLNDLTSGAMGKKWVEGAKLKKAQVQLAQEKYSDARSLFREVQSSSNSAFALEARIGYAACQIGSKQYPGAAETLKEVLGEGRKERNTQPPRYGELRAKAWLVLGKAEEGAANGDRVKLQWAAIRYLRASVVGMAGGEVFAESLYRARAVFERLGQEERVEAITQRMNQLCPDSPWTQR